MKKMLILLIVSFIPLKSFATSNPSLEQDIGYCYSFIRLQEKFDPQGEIAQSGVLEEIKAITQLKLIEIDLDNTTLLAQNYAKTLFNVAVEAKNTQNTGYRRLFKIGWNSCAKLEISGFKYIE